MAHHVYQTPGIVLGGFGSDEASRFVYIFTRDLGLIGGTAQGVRLLKSKLRYSLQDLTYADVSLVRGKSSWKIVNARYRHNALHAFEERREHLLAFARIIALVKRLVRGEEKNEDLFVILTDAFTFLTESTLSAQDAHNFECLVVLRILRSLGYLAHNQTLLLLTDSSEYTVEMLHEVERLKKEVVGEINKSLAETQL
jgi:DNA repair protein RecO